MTLSRISREIQKKHGSDAGPKAQTISNDPDGLLRYVDARKREARRVSESLGSPRARKRGADFDLIYGAINDSDARIRLNDLQDRCFLAEKSLDRAKAVLKLASPGVDPDALLAGVPCQPQQAGLEAKEIAALKELALILSNTVKLANFGLTRDQNGRIWRKSGTGDVLFSPALTNAIEALSKRLSGQ